MKVFLKTKGIFFAYSVHQDSDARNKTNYFSIENSCTSGGLPIETKMKESSPAFLRKSELHFKGNSVVIALSDFPCGDHRTICFSRSVFEVSLFFLTPEKLEQWKKVMPKKRKKVQLLTSIINFLEHIIN